MFRIYRRRKTCQLWRDDYFALFALLWDCFFSTTLWIGASQSRVALIFNSWVAQITFVPLIWSTRISLAFSIARLIPSKQIMWTASIGLVYLCGGFCLGFLLHISILCAEDVDGWMQVAPYQCPLSSSIAIARLVADVLSDFALIILPISAFWHRLKLLATTRRLIQACFCASMLTATCNIVLSALLFWHSNSSAPQERQETVFLAMVTPHLLAAISLLVCNGLVVVTSVYRLFRTEPPSRPIGDPKNSPPAPTSTDIIQGMATGSTAATESPVNMPSRDGQYQDSTPDSHLANTRTSTSSDFIELTELSESDLAHSIPYDIERN
ncbi:hypothetical protein CVT26_011699 [Gymnopilus dilepis]|uniref:Rhodopsin domain-containing protein n=1 Tax=Gymnopilus dilepis TaxID=231916 RepID=A0A409YGZ7_9AGAR|nr:hypothetical protein CVT26_011699 [Gymnopilus dilepis]